MLLDGDSLLLPKRTSGLFESAFAHAEFLMDFLCRAVVVERPKSATGLEFSEDLGFEVVHLAAACGVEAEVDLTIWPDGGDVAFDGLAGLEILEDIVGKNQAAVGVIDDRLVAEVRLAKNDEIHFLAEAERGWRSIHVPGDARRGDQASGLLVGHDVGDVMATDFHADFLLAKRDHEILREAPVEKCSDGGDGDAF